MEKPVLDYPGAPGHGLGGSHPEHSSVMRRTFSALVSELAAELGFSSRGRRAKLIHSTASHDSPKRLRRFFPNTRMKTVLTLILACLALTLGAQEDNSPVMPETVTLKSGRVLRNVEVIRWESNRVVLKYAGGADPVPFSIFKDPDPSQLPAIRAAEQKAAKAAALAAAKAAAAEKSKGEDLIEYHGQAFIMTKGAGNYKIGGMTVLVLPPEAEEAFSSTYSTVSLPKPIAKASTDADGKFTFKLPAGQKFFLFGQSHRQLPSGNVEEYEWRVPSHKITNPASVLLNSWNNVDRHSRVEFSD